MTDADFDDLKQRLLARGPAVAVPITEAELLADLSRLLREGLVRVDQADEHAVPRFDLTPRGREEVDAVREDTSAPVLTIRDPMASSSS